MKIAVNRREVVKLVEVACFAARLLKNNQTNQEKARVKGGDTHGQTKENQNG